MQDQCFFEVVDDPPERQWEGIVLRVAFALQFYIPLVLLAAAWIFFALPAAVLTVLLLVPLTLFVLCPWLIYSCVDVVCSIKTSLIILTLLNLSLYISFFYPNTGYVRLFTFFALYNTLATTGYLIVVFFGKDKFFSEWKNTHVSWLSKIL